MPKLRIPPMSKLSIYILGQLRGVTHLYEPPVLQTVIYNGYDIVNLVFYVRGSDDPVIITLDSSYLSSLDPELAYAMKVSRDVFRETLQKVITRCIDKDFKKEPREFDFTQPMCKELVKNASEIAEAIMDQDYLMNANVPYINSLCNPFLAFCVIRFIVEIMNLRNIPIPPGLTRALDNPNRYLNPIIVAEEFDKFHGEETEVDGNE